MQSSSVVFPAPEAPKRMVNPAATLKLDLEHKGRTRS